MKKQMPETDWEIMQADSNIVEPKKATKKESEEKNELSDSSSK